MSAPSSNRLLSALNPANQDHLTSLCTAVSLPLRTFLYEPDQVPAYAYFITSGLASVVTPMIDGGTAEVELVGHEGIVGSLHLLGSAPVQTSCFMQLAGTGLRIELAALRRAFRTSDEVHDRILEFVQEQALVVSQMAGCNRLHEAEVRLARWILMAQDRTQSEVLNLTQEFLAQMLGTQRTTVTNIAGAMQRSGLLEYQQGRVKIPNRALLETAACECYGVAKKLYTNLYQKPLIQVLESRHPSVLEN